MAVTAFFKRKQPWTRHLTHVLFWAFLALTPLFWFRVVDVYGHDLEWSLAPLSFMSALGFLVPSAAFRIFAPKTRESAVAHAETLIVFATVASWIGAFGLYRLGLGYDTLVHVVNSAALTAAFALLLAARRMRPMHKVVLAAAALMFACGLVNEGFEWGYDRVFGTGTYGEVGEPGDTAYDLMGNVAGIAFAGSLVLTKTRKPKA